MEPYLHDRFGNPSSLHSWGQEARGALEEARAELAGAIGAKSSEVYFVRGGTESDNLALTGTVLAGPTSHRSLAVSAVEHSAVLETAAWLHEAMGVPLTTVSVSPSGEVDIRAVEEAANAHPVTCSMMWANNETGQLLPLSQIVDVVKDADGVVHSDACQALGKVPVDVRSVQVDLLSGTGHKIEGPKGAGFLFVRTGTDIHPRIFGGSQERGVRPGTEDVAGAVGLARAVRLATEEQDSKARRLGALRSQMERCLVEMIPGVRINSSAADRATHVLSVGIPEVEDGAALLMALDVEGIAASGGSACHSASGSGSHVIGALYGADDPYVTVRFSFGSQTTEEEVKKACTVLARVVTRLSARGESGALAP